MTATPRQLKEPTSPPHNGRVCGPPHPLDSWLQTLEWYFRIADTQYEGLVVQRGILEESFPKDFNTRQKRYTMGLFPCMSAFEKGGQYGCAAFQTL